MDCFEFLIGSEQFHVDKMDWKRSQQIKLIYSEKALKFCEISIVDLSYIVPVKSTVKILQNFVAFSEYMNFTTGKYVIIFWLKNIELVW